MLHALWLPEITIRQGQVSEPRPRVNLGKIPNTNFTKREIAFVLLVIWWAVQDPDLRPPACKAGGNSI